MLTIIFFALIIIFIVMAYYFGGLEKENKMIDKLFQLDKECREYKDKQAAERFYDRVFNEFLK